MSDSGKRARRGSKFESAYGIKVATKEHRSKRRKDGTREPKWETLLNSVGLRFVVFLIRKIARGMSGVFNSTFFLCLPFAVLLFITSTDFLILTAVSDSVDQLFFDDFGLASQDSRRSEVELLKTQVLKVVYLYIFVFSISQTCPMAKSRSKPMIWMPLETVVSTGFTWVTRWKVRRLLSFWMLTHSPPSCWLKMLPSLVC